MEGERNQVKEYKLEDMLKLQKKYSAISGADWNKYLEEAKKLIDKD